MKPDKKWNILHDHVKLWKTLFAPRSPPVFCRLRSVRLYQLVPGIRESCITGDSFLQIMTSMIILCSLYSFFV